MRYVKNKAGLTGQTVPGRRIPGHWPYPGPEELAETEPCVPGLIDVRFFVSFNTPHERVLAKLGRHGARQPRLGLTINWLGISEVVSLNPSNW